MKKVKYLIIGAGPCGLGAGYRLKELGIEDFLIVEKENWVGGLASSFRDDKGFLWDIGGHVLFSHYPYFDKAVDQAIGLDGWYQHQRQAWIWHQQSFVPYPFQNNLHHLPALQANKCLQALKKQRANPKKNHPHFSSWLEYNFGEELCQIFMYPYNQKVWGTDLTKMSHQWISERVSLISPDEVEQTLQKKEDQTQWGPNAMFRFPKKGGTGAIWKGIAEQVGADKIVSNQALQSIDIKNNIASFSQLTIQYEYLLSTIPLKKLCLMFPESIHNKLESVKNLQHSKTHIIGLGLKGQLPNQLKEKCWVYFAHEKYPFYRLTVFSNYSPDHVPDPRSHFSLMLEVCETSTQPQSNAETLSQQCFKALRDGEIIPKDCELISEWHYQAPYGYPIPTVERDSILNCAIPELEKNNIYSRGRFGAWKYEVSNQDHTFMQGVEWVNARELDEDEVTFKL